MRQAAQTLALLVMACVAGAGCGGTERKPVSEEPVVTTTWGHRDLQMAAEKLAASLAQSAPARAHATPPVVYFARVVNKTDQHIDMKNITDRIRVILMRQGGLRFTASTEAQDEIVSQLRFQTGALVDPATAKRIGRQIGADYFLFGELTAMTEKEGRTRGVYYKLTLNLVNIETGIIEWSDDADFQKVHTRGILGL